MIKYRSKLLSRVVALCTCAMLICAVSVPAFAADGDGALTIDDNTATVNGSPDKKASTAGGTDSIESGFVLPDDDVQFVLASNTDPALSRLTYYSTAGGKKVATNGFKPFVALGGNKYTFNKTDFATMSDSDKVLAMKVVTQHIGNNAMSQASRQQVYDNLRSVSDDAVATALPLIFDNTKADMFTALKIFQPFSSPICVALGVGVVFLVVCIVGSTLLDFIYIGLPFARRAGTGDSNGGAGGQSKPIWVTNEAYSSVTECESGTSSGSSGGHYKNPYCKYLWRRMGTYIILGICILYLLSGQIVGLISIVMHMVSGFKLAA